MAIGRWDDHGPAAVQVVCTTGGGRSARPRPFAITTLPCLGLIDHCRLSFGEGSRDSQAVTQLNEGFLSPQKGMSSSAPEGVGDKVARAAGLAAGRGEAAADGASMAAFVNAASSTPSGT